MSRKSKIIVFVVLLAVAVVSCAIRVAFIVIPEDDMIAGFRATRTTDIICYAVSAICLVVALFLGERIHKGQKADGK